MGISYSDGDEVEAFVLSLLQSTEALSSLDAIGQEHYQHWPIRYHLTPLRSNLVRHLTWTSLDVLEIGAGMGAVSRFLAEECNRLMVVEGTQRRYDALSARLRDLSNWEGTTSNITDIELEPSFDVVCLVGVLEYSELYVKSETGESPFVNLLKKAKSALRPGGVLLVAIENQIGLKYFAGCNEDHTGNPFDGICGYPSKPSPRTFTRGHLKNLLTQAGFQRHIEQFPYPDYKLPTCVMDAEMFDLHPETAVELASLHSYYDHGDDDNLLFPSGLVLNSLSDQPQLLMELSNSFLFLATENLDSPILDRLIGKSVGERREMAWHYAKSRKHPVNTVFRDKNGTLEVEKSVADDALVSNRKYTDGVMEIEWIKPETAPEIKQPKLMREMQRLAYFRDYDRFAERISDFFRWISERFAVEGRPDQLLGTALDAHPGNAFIGEKAERYMLFDQEWFLTKPFPKSWFVLRIILSFERDLSVLVLDQWPSNKDIYEHLCSVLGVQPALDSDLDLEARLLSLLGDKSDIAANRALLKDHLFSDPPVYSFPRTRHDLDSGDRRIRKRQELLVAEIDRLKEVVDEQSRQHQRKIYWLPRTIDKLIVSVRDRKKA